MRLEGGDDALKNLQRLFAAAAVQGIQHPQKVVAFGRIAHGQAVLQHVIRRGVQRVENQEECFQLWDFIPAFNIGQIARGDADFVRTIL